MQLINKEKLHREKVVVEKTKKKKYSDKLKQAGKAIIVIVIPWCMERQYIDMSPKR